MPFRAFRPHPDLASQLACVPYDVINTTEAKLLAGNNQYSYLRVIRPEIDLDPSHDPYSPEVYKLAAKNLTSFITKKILIQDPEPALYVYQLQMGDQVQTGLAGLTSVDDYDQGLIKLHEKTRVEKEQDRIQHITTCGAHTEPVFLTYRNDETLTSLLMAETAGDPLYKFEADDGIRHTIWRVKELEAIRAAFLRLPCLYIADGHHRAAAASSCRAKLRSENPGHQGDEAYNFFLSVTFPHNQLKILPYNRIVKRTPVDPEALFETLTKRFQMSETKHPSPSCRGNVCMYIGGRWYELLLLKSTPPPCDPVEALDVSLLQERILAPLFSIGDPRQDKNIDFVGGLRGTEELKRLVDDGTATAAFSMFPVPIEDLFTVADQGRCMAPKSTWFEPKLRSGLLVHKFV
ncbi:MAG: DUF1015 domain-containing protein [Deltaproteobacteria bacterium]|nr:DUF1015 domain-containing protein [Deltaproteobacteria bacterium]